MVLMKMPKMNYKSPPKLPELKVMSSSHLSNKHHFYCAVMLPVKTANKYSQMSWMSWRSLSSVLINFSSVSKTKKGIKALLSQTCYLWLWESSLTSIAVHHGHPVCHCRQATRTVCVCFSMTSWGHLHYLHAPVVFWFAYKKGVPLPT